MRLVLTGVTVGAMALAVGCNSLPHRRGLDGGGGGQQFSSATPTANELVKYLNDNSSRVQGLQCEQLDLDITQKLQSFHVEAKLACQKPRNFRMRAYALGKTEADVGSNEQEFWFWVGKGEPYLFHCSHQDFATGKPRMAFPFQPEWVVEAIGLGEYDASKDRRVEVRGNSIQLIEQATSPQGKPVRKVVVFNRGRDQVQVRAHLLQDATGKQTICSAVITEVQQDRTTGAVVPKKVELNWPEERLTMKMKLDGLTVNPNFDQRAAALFSRPQMPGIATWDLARGPDAPGGVRQTGGYR